MGTQSKLAQYAIRYAKLGWHIFPLIPQTKIPYSRADMGVPEDAPAGVALATNNVDQVRAWWERFPNANIGLAAGPSGFLVVDNDSYKAGARELPAGYGDTMTAVTGRGGEHLFYQMPEGKRYGNSSGNLPDWVDIRGYGGYVVLPPSIHPDTRKPYQWKKRPGETAAAALPADIRDALEKAGQGERRAVVTPSTGAAHTYDSTPEIETVRDALKCIPPTGDYQDHWLAILMAIHSEYPGGTGITLAESWSPGYPGEIAKKFKSFDKTQRDGVTIGTLFHIAKEHGWQPPQRAQKRERAALAYAGQRGHTITLQGDYLTRADYDPQPGARVRLHANTGVGKNTWALSLPGRLLIVCSTVFAVQQQYAKALATGRAAGVYYGDEKTVGPHTDIAITTYNSLKHCKRAGEFDYDTTSLIFDEMHNTAAAGGYRRHALNDVAKRVKHPWQRVIAMTGTPVATSHPDLAALTPIYVQTPLREQRAERIIYKDENGNGIKRETILSEILSAYRRGAGLQLVQLENKGDELEWYLAALAVAGVPDKHIATSNADNRDNETGRRIAEDEKIPETVRILFATSVLAESANILNRCDEIHLATHPHPIMAQQFVNRFRTGAALVVKLYNSGAGKGFIIPSDEFRQTVEGMAGNVLAKYRATAELDPNDESPAAYARRLSTRLMGGGQTSLVRSQQDDSGGRRWALDYIAIDALVFDLERQYTRRNPLAFKNMTAAYGWQWQPDRESIVKPDKATAERRAAIAEELKAERLRRWREQVLQISDESPAENDAAIFAGQGDAIETRARVGMAHLLDAMTEYADPAQVLAMQSVAWMAAARLADETGDSARKQNTAVRRVRIARLRASGNKLIKTLHRRIMRGGRWTGETLQAMFLDVFKRHPILSALAFNELGYAWRGDVHTIATTLTPTKALQLAGDMVDLCRTSTRDAAGDVVNVYDVRGPSPLADVVPILLYALSEEDKSTKKSAYKTIGSPPLEMKKPEPMPLNAAVFSPMPLDRTMAGAFTT